MGNRIVKTALSLPFLIAAGLFGTYLLFGFFLVNPLAQKLLPWVGEEKFASQLSVQDVKFNPLTLEATVRGLKLAEPNGTPLARFERLYVNLSLTGVFRWAWRIQDIQLDKPTANFEVARSGRFNWQTLLDKLAEDKTPPSDSMARVLIDHIRIAGGDIDYIDANRAGKPFRVSLRPLGIELDGLSTLPEDRGDYLIAAKLPEQGGTLKWKGDIALNPLASSGTLGLESVQIARLLRVIKSPRKFDIPGGTLAAGLNYRFALVRDAAGNDQPWVRIAGANLIVQNLAVAPRDGGAPVLALTEARIGNANLDLATRRVDVASIRLAGGQLAATRAANGTLDWQTLFAPESASAAAPQKTPPVDKPVAATPAWKIAVADIRIADWAARFTDRGFAAPLSVSATGFGLSAALAGEVGARTALVLGPVNAALGPVQVQSGTREVASLARAALINANLKLAEQQLEIEAVELSGARTEVRLDQNRQVNWNAILRKSPGAAAPAPTTAPEAAQPLTLSLARFVLDDVAVGVIDESTTKPVRLDLTQGRVALRDLSLDLNKPVPLEAAFALKQGGRFSASGSVTPGKTQGRLDLKLAGLALKPFAPYVNQFARLDLQSGAASTRGKLVFAPGKAGTRVDFDGGFVVDDLAITEEDTGEAFLGWKKLSSDSLDLALAPNRLRIGELVAQYPFGKVIIFEDRSVNLKRILRSNAPAGTSTAAAPSKPAAVKPASPPPLSPLSAAEPAFPVAIERVRIVEANAEFADLSLTPQFGTRMHGLSGVITGLSTDARSSAQVELDGKVDDYGSARVRGTLQPFQATEFTDLTLTFRNLEMANLTPYSGKFAGRRIDSGTLSVDLEYKIKQRQLAGENKFIVNKLKLGERVDSPDAMNLPLDLAIALLEDSNGVIDLDLPVSGSLDDPQFSYGKIIWKAIVNVLTKLVTAPFRALGKLLGGDAEKFEAVVFDPGSSVLLPPEQGKLKTLADALAKRPVLTLTVTPGYDPDADKRALQVLAIRQAAAKVAGIKLAAGETPGPVDVNLYKIQTWLEDRYIAVAGKDDYQKLRAGFQDKNASAATRVLESETVERLARRFKTRADGPPSAFHAELLERLTQQTRLPDDALTQLGQARGQAAQDALVKLGLAAARISVAAPAKQTLKDKFVGSTMTLGAGAANR